MAQTNVIVKIPTPTMKAEAKGKIYIAKEKDNSLAEKNAQLKHTPSLESELASKGWRYFQNDFKNYLNELKRKEFQANNMVEENAPDTDPYENNPEAQKAMDELINASLECAEIYDEHERKALKATLTRALEWDDAHSEFIYTAPQIKGTSNLLKDAIKDILLKDNKKASSEIRKYKRQLFGLDGVTVNRKLVLQFAYLLRMTSEDTETYLTKWAFLDAIRWDDPWELAAAYHIECDPARAEDRACDFIELVEKRVQQNNDDPTNPENENYLRFIYEKEQQEYSAWIDSYYEHCKQNKRDAFLYHWAWLLLISRLKKSKTRIIPDISYSVLGNQLPGIYDSLVQYIHKHVAGPSKAAVQNLRGLTAEEESLQKEIISVMKNRQLRLMAAVYTYGRRLYVPIEFLYQGHRKSYVPPQIKEWFLPAAYQQEETTDESNWGEFNQKKDGDPCLTLTRSHIISIGIELALTAKGINHLLTIGGYYELYDRDFFEYGLVWALNELEHSNIPNDGARFAVSDCTLIVREDEDVYQAGEKLKKICYLCLEDNYNQLRPENRTECAKSEPRWIKDSIHQVSFG